MQIIQTYTAKKILCDPLSLYYYHTPYPCLDHARYVLQASSSIAFALLILWNVKLATSLEEAIKSKTVPSNTSLRFSIGHKHIFLSIFAKLIKTKHYRINQKSCRNGTISISLISPTCLCKPVFPLASNRPRRSLLSPQNVLKRGTYCSQMHSKADLHMPKTNQTGYKYQFLSLKKKKTKSFFTGSTQVN